MTLAAQGEQGGESAQLPAAIAGQHPVFEHVGIT